MAIYRVHPQDARHGALVIAAEAITPGLQRLCDAFAEDGYETTAADDDALDAVLDAVGEPRFVIGLGAGAAAAWRAAGERTDLSAAALFYPPAAPDGAALCPVILQVSKRGGEPPEADYPVFAYGAAPGFLLDDDPAFDAEAARLATLRTLALFRRSAASGES